MSSAARFSARLLLALCASISLLTAGCGDNDEPVAPDVEFPPVASFDADVLLAWGEKALALTKGSPGFTPPVASRAFGYLGLAVYEALVPGMPGYRSLAGQVNGLEPLPAAESGDRYHWPSVVNSAFASMARRLYANAPAALQDEIDALESELAASFAAEADADVLERSIARGRTVADAVFIHSLGDGGHEGYRRNFPEDYVPPVGPGLWVPTPQLSGAPPLRALQPYWGSNRPFVLPDGGDPNAACEPGPPPAYSTDTASVFYRDAFEVYTTCMNATQAQRDIALYWSDDPGQTATPPGHSVSILLQLLDAEGKDLAFAAEAFAKVGIAVADAFIACWQTKYEYNVLRPITYIREEIDPTWEVIVNTPPFPEFSSGHSVQSGAAFGVLEEMFGESYAFVDHTHDARGLTPRAFASFAAAADEAAISRLYGGIHYRAAIERGIDQGRCIAEAVNALEFRRTQRTRIALRVTDSPPASSR